MFFITLLLEEVLSWTRKQPGTSSLRAILYFDEVFGYLPPHPANPPTQDAADDAAEAGAGVRRRRAAGDAEPGGPRLQGAVERRHVVRRQAADGARQGAAARGAGRRGGRARHADTTARTWRRSISALGNRVFLLHNIHAARAGGVPDAVGAVVPARPDDARADRQADGAAEDGALGSPGSFVGTDAAIAPSRCSSSVPATGRDNSSTRSSRATPARSASSCSCTRAGGREPGACPRPHSTARSCCTSGLNHRVGPGYACDPTILPADPRRRSWWRVCWLPAVPARMCRRRRLRQEDGPQVSADLAPIVAAPPDGQAADWSKAEAIPEGLDNQPQPAKFGDVPSSLSTPAKAAELRKQFEAYLAGMKVKAARCDKLNMTIGDKEDLAGFTARRQKEAWKEFEKKIAEEKGRIYGGEFCATRSSCRSSRRR